MSLDGNTVYNSDTSLSSVTLGTTGTPTITHVQGDLSITGTTTGAGVLIIDSALDISGDLTYEGIVMIGICETCPGRLLGTGNAKIYGAMVLANPTAANGGTSFADFDGNAFIYYSCSALQNLADKLGNTFATVSWSEVR